MGQHCEDAPVIILALRNAELHEHMTHVSLDRALAQVQPLCDPRVGQPLRHQLEHLAFPLSELGQTVVFAAGSDETSDHLRIER